MLHIGTEIEDGTVYVGACVPGTGDDIYVFPLDRRLTLTWQEATAYAANTGKNGYRDWRLPGMNEMDVIRWGIHQRHLAETFALVCNSKGCWTSTILGADRAWWKSLGAGFDGPSDRSECKYMILVRSVPRP